jgi:hypothetical protein
MLTHRDADDPKQAIIALILKASQAKAEGEARKAATHRAMKAELEQLKMPELRQRATAAGVPADSVEDARDADDPKAAMIELILGQSAQQP